MTTAAMPDVLWQKPAPLEGVKSRKKLIFDVPTAFCKSGNSITLERDFWSVSRFSGLKLSLESRIAAVGTVGRASIDLLLGNRQLLTGTLWRHDSLTVVHLGPHLLDKPQQSVEEYLAAVGVVLEQRPQVIILDEAAAAENEAWNLTFESFLGSETVHAFRGALVICASEETPAVKRVCSQRWAGAGSWLWQEEIEDDDDLELWEDVLSMRREEALSEPFMQEVCDLAWQKPFVEDVIAKARAKGWILTVLTTSSPLGCNAGEVQEDSEAAPLKDASKGSRHLAGFICYMICPGTKFYITRVAVPEVFRKAGHGRRLMRWALEKAAKMPRSEIPWLGLFALDEAVPFYANFGFVDMTLDEVDEKGHVQTYMEMKNESLVLESLEQ